MATYASVKAYLVTVRRCLDAGRVELLSRREKNRATLLRLEFTTRSAVAELAHLRPEDYIGGPKASEINPRGVVWEFVRSIKDIPVYIKLTVKEYGPNENVLCISFHEPEREYEKPYARPDAADGGEEE
jgi:hypothetical protein